MTSALLAALLLSVGPTPTLREAVGAYQNLHDAAAAAAFQQILAQNPPSEVASKAHLYLGLIAFAAIHPDQARAEFKAAIRANPAIELPADTSPKAMFAFAQARQEVMHELDRQEARAPRALQIRSQGASTSAQVVHVQWEDEPPPPHSHVLSLSLGGVAVAAAVVAIIGGIQVLNYNSLAASDNNQLGKNSAQPVIAAQGSANFWRYAWIGFAAGGALSLTGSILTW